MWTYRMEDLKNTSWSQICCKVVSLSVWPDWYNSGQIRIHCEDLRKLDCIDFVLSITAFPMVTDDIFNPQLMEWQTWRTSSRGSAMAIPLVPCSFKLLLRRMWSKRWTSDDGNVKAAVFICETSFWQYEISPQDLSSTCCISSWCYMQVAVRIHVCLMPSYKVNRIPLHVAHLRMHLLPHNVIILHDLQGVNTLIFIFQTLILFHLLHWCCNLTCYIPLLYTKYSVSFLQDIPHI